MSAQYLNQIVPNKDVNIRANDVIIDNVINTKDLQINNFFYKTSHTVNQTTSATTSVDASYKTNVTINTMTFTTPHSSNNITKFIVTYYDCSTVTDVVSCSIQRYNGTTGQPIITGRCLDDSQYEISIINLHQNEDLNGTFRLSLELTYFL
tara:strand:+ start:330 stop:782 length:453 start_codon:yes stop_codon:yes gene_type:complete